MINKHKTLTNISDAYFPRSYFVEEVREGFYIPTMMKRYWAGQIRVLQEIDKVCRKHEIKWFAIYGTLLGAVRHGGYIPWDDDLDICMLRSDYERFFAVAKDEFPNKYSIFNAELDPDNDTVIGRIVNNGTKIDYSDEHLKEYMGCPYTIGVDVFPLDNIYDDADKEEDRIRRATDIMRAVDKMDADESETVEMRRLLVSIEKDNHTIIHRGRNLRRELILLMEQVYKENRSDASEDVAFMHIWTRYRGNRFPRRIFEYVINLSFENVYLPSPGRYDELLRIAYGDYMTVKRGGGEHGYPLYDAQEQIMRSKIGGNPDRYTFSVDEFGRHLAERIEHKTTNVLCEEMTAMLETVADRVVEYSVNGQRDAAMRLLEGSQNIAISLGTMLEDRTVDSGVPVSLLEDYCEHLYIWHETLNTKSAEINHTDDEKHKPQDLMDIKDTTKRLCEGIRDFLTHRKKRIIFLPCTARWWSSMNDYYLQYENDKECEIYVMNVPYYLKEFGNSAVMIDTDGEFPEGIVLKDVHEYDFLHGYADEMVIQIPYDKYNTCISVPDFFCSSNLVKYTDKLTYIPYLQVDAPNGDDHRAIKSLGSFIEQPVAIYADSIVLDQAGLKGLYVDKLTALAGEETRNYWGNKFIIISNELTGTDMKKSVNYEKNISDNILKIVNGRKILMNYIDTSYLLQYGKEAIEKIRRNLEVFNASSDSICCLFVEDEGIYNSIVCFNPSTDKETGLDRKAAIDEIPDQKYLMDIRTQYRIVVDEIRITEGYMVVNYSEADLYLDIVDAYYGSAGVLAHKCRNRGKPVMIMRNIV